MNGAGGRDYGGYADRVVMDEADFEAQHAWVTAKRLHEQGTNALAPAARFGTVHGEHPTGFPRNRTCRPASSL